MMTVWPLILLLWTFLHKHTFFSQLRRLWLLHFISWEKKRTVALQSDRTTPLPGKQTRERERDRQERKTVTVISLPGCVMGWKLFYCFSLCVLLVCCIVWFYAYLSLVWMFLFLFIYLFFFCLLPILIKEMIHTCSFCIKDGRWVQSQIMYSRDTSIKRAQLQQSNRTNRMDRPDRPDRC